MCLCIHLYLYQRETGHYLKDESQKLIVKASKRKIIQKRENKASAKKGRDMSL